MQYARYGKPTGTSFAAIKASMKKKGRLPAFVPSRSSKSAQAILNSQELKVGDTTFSALTVDSTTELISESLNLITQGDANTNRDGNVVELKSIEWNFDFDFVPAASTVAASTLHFWLVQDRQPNGANPAITDVLTSNNAALAMPNTAYQYRFKILKKEVLDFNSHAGVSTAYNNCVQNLRGYYKFKKPVQIRFKGNAGTVADVATNNFFIIMGSTYSDDAILYSGVTRIRFTG